MTLERHGGAYAVSGIVVRQGRPTVDGVEAGDRLLAVDGHAVGGEASGAVLRALGGVPGAIHSLTLDRAGRRLEVRAPVTAF